MSDIDARMDRLESKLEDRLARIDMKLDLIVRLEERQVQSDESLRRAFLRIEKLEGRIREMEIQSSGESVKTNTNSKTISWFVGVIGSVFTGLVVWHLKG